MSVDMRILSIMRDMDKKTYTERVITPMTKEMVEAIDDYRFANRFPNRSDAIRHLIEIALEVEKQQEIALQHRANANS